GEHVFHHPYLAVVVERNVDVRLRDEVERQAPAARAAYGEPHRPIPLREERERGRKGRTRLLLREAEEAPRPLPVPDVCGRELAELRTHGLEARGHEVEELAGTEAERCPVELFVREKPGVLLAATAVEVDAEDGRVCGSWQLLDGPEGRERHVRLPSHGTGERVAARQRV